MAIEVFKNFSSAALTVAVSTTPAPGTIETWTLGTTSSLPILPNIQYESRAQVNNPSGTVISPEIIQIIDILSDTTISVIRGAEGSAITPHNVGDIISIVQTAAQMTPTPWQSPTLINGWTYFGSGTKPGYRATAIGDVELCGIYANAVANSASIASTPFIMNIGFIPDSIRYIQVPILICSGTGFAAASFAKVFIDGTVAITPEGTGTVVLMSLDGVHFSLTSPV